MECKIFKLGSLNFGILSEGFVDNSDNSHHPCCSTKSFSPWWNSAIFLGKARQWKNGVAGFGLLIVYDLLCNL